LPADWHCASSTLPVVGGLSAEACCTVTADRTWDVSDLKAEIQRQVGIPRDVQRLLDGSRLLLNDEVLFQVLHREVEAEVEAVLRLLILDSDWAEVMLAIESGRIQLQDTNERYRADRDIVLTAVRRSGEALEHAEEELRADSEVVMAAVQQSGRALHFAAETLQADVGMALAAVSQNGLVLEMVPEALRANREVTLAAVRQNGFALEFAVEAMQADRDVVLAAVKGEGRALRFAARSLQEDREVIIAACTSNNECEQYVPSDLLMDPEVSAALMNGLRVGGDMGFMATTMGHHRAMIFGHVYNFCKHNEEAPDRGDAYEEHCDEYYEESIASSEL